MSLPKIVCNVLRHQQLGKPHEWADGDYSKVWPDGRTEPASYADYCASIGLPVGPNERIEG